MPLKRQLRIKMPDGELLVEDLPTDKSDFELRCARGLARRLGKALGIEVTTELITDDVITRPDGMRDSP